MPLSSVFLSLGFALLTLPVSAQTLGTKGSVLDDAKWTNRLLLICGESNAALGSPLQKDQFALVDWPGYAERDIVIIGVSVGTSIVFETASFADPRLNPRVHVWKDGDPALERKANCMDGSPSLTLVGKDGGVKKVWTDPVSNKDLFAIIDAMPMRQSEMRGAGD